MMALMNVITDYHAEFVEAVETYLRESGMSAFQFGLTVMNDPKFVYDLREGREPRRKTQQRVINWINENPVNNAAK